MKQRLINAFALISEMQDKCCGECDLCIYCRYENANYFCGLIETAPTVAPIDEAFSTAIDKYGDNTFSVSVISSKGEKIDFKRVKRGKWIEEDKPWGGFDDFVLALTCSECGESFVYHGDNPKFCPECGAEMKEDEV